MPQFALVPLGVVSSPTLHPEPRAGNGVPCGPVAWSLRGPSCHRTRPCHSTCLLQQHSPSDKDMSSSTARRARRQGQLPQAHLRPQSLLSRPRRWPCESIQAAWEDRAHVNTLQVAGRSEPTLTPLQAAGRSKHTLTPLLSFLLASPISHLPRTQCPEQSGFLQEPSPSPPAVGHSRPASGRPDDRLDRKKNTSPHLKTWPIYLN